MIINTPECIALNVPFYVDIQNMVFFYKVES